MRKQAGAEPDEAVDEEDGGGGRGARVTDETDDRAERLAALEEMATRGEIDQAILEKLQTELGVGGDLDSTHRVKGLDFELLRRVKAGEDVSTAAADKRDKAAGDDGGRDAANDDEEELDRVLGETVEPVKKETRAKKGTMAPPPAPGSSSAGATGGGKMTRDEILSRLKASRANAATGATTDAKEEAPASTLGAKFKKLGDAEKNKKKRWVETDENGRRKEVLLTTDREGKTKRKVRWLDKPTETAPNANGGLLPVDKHAKPLGMDVPADILSRAKMAEEQQQDDEDDDIFQGAGDDYNPLADAEDSDSTSESDAEEGTKGEKQELPPLEDEKEKAEEAEEAEATVEESAQPPKPGHSRRRDYFATETTVQTAEEPKADANPLTSDPTIMATFKRAASIRQGATSSGAAGDTDVPEDDEQRRKKFLEEARKREKQDAMDMDMGFGGSRFGDEEDEGGLQGQGTTGDNKRKRGPKKKKGDKESAGDVMKVLEGRKKGGDTT